MSAIVRGKDQIEGWERDLGSKLSPFKGRKK
jgi:hypothetical protein